MSDYSYVDIYLHNTDNYISIRNVMCWTQTSPDGCNAVQEYNIIPSLPSEN